jgi:hypothetical protein
VHHAVEVTWKVALFLKAVVYSGPRNIRVEDVTEPRVSGRDVKGLITRRFKLVDFEKALQTADNHAKKPLKVVITE